MEAEMGGTRKRGEWQFGQGHLPLVEDRASYQTGGLPSADQEISDLLV